MIVLKIILFIILAVLGIILLALFMPVSVKFSFIGEEVVYKVRYSFLGVIDSDGGGIVGKLLNKTEKPEKQKSRKTKQDTAKESSAPTVSSESSKQPEMSEAAEKGGDDKSSASNSGSTAVKSKKPKEIESNSSAVKERRTLGEMVGFLMDIWSSAKRPFRKILKGFRFSELYIDFLVADEDAYKCAVNYGRVCAIVYNGLSSVSRLFTAKYKTIDVECGFGKDKSRWDASFSVRFIPMTAVISGMWFLITYIFRIYLPNMRSSKKSAAKQKTQPQGGM